MNKRDHLTKRTRKQLEEALKNANALCDSSDQRTCAISPEHKKAVQLYVKTWIAGYISAALNNESWTERYLT